MRLTWVAVILLAVFIAGCTIPELPFQESIIGESTSVKENPDIYVSSEVIPTEVKSEREAKIYFLVENKHPDLDLDDVKTEVYDACLFLIDEGEEDIGTLKANRTKEFNFKMTATQAEFERNCEIRYKTEYTRAVGITQTLAVLQEAEYYARQQDGTLGEIDIIHVSDPSPLSISISFSDTQPFIDGEEKRMHIDYWNTGDGIIHIDDSWMSLRFPENVENIECNNYEKSESSNYTFVLNVEDEMSFIGGKAPRTTCTFTTSAVQPINSGNLLLTGTYKYMFDDSLFIKIKPR